jgi:hypothetical protein
LPSRVKFRPRTYHVPRRLTPSLDSLVSFQPGALSGCTLQSFTGQRSSRFSAGLPLLRLAIRPPKQTFSLLTSFCLRTARDWPSKTCSSNSSPKRTVPLGLVVLKRFRRRGIAAAAASLQGFNPSADWGLPSPDFSACDSPGSPGIHPPWGIPLPSLGLVGATRACCCRRARARPARSNRALGLLSALRGVPYGSCSLCFRVSKSWEVGLPLARPPAP